MKASLVAALLCLLATACTKQPEFSNSSTNTQPAPSTGVQAASSSKTAAPDVLYHYQGQAYPLYFQEGSTEDFVEDENFTRLQTATSQSDIVTFTYSDQPANHVYLFDSEWEGYDYMERNGDNPLLGRKFKLSLRIDQLRENLRTQFGEQLDFKNPTVALAAQQGVEAIYEELHVNLPFPNDLEAFIGVVTDGFARPKTGSAMNSAPVLTVWEHDNFGGAELYVDQAPNTVIWNYGGHNCFTMAANPDLTLEFKPDGTNWNDCISSKCLSYIQGADAMAEGYYKDSHFGIYPCSRMIYMYYSNGTGTGLPLCANLSIYPWQGGAWCGHINDQISSIRIKAVWEGCYTDDNVFLDMINQ